MHAWISYVLLTSVSPAAEHYHSSSTSADLDDELDLMQISKALTLVHKHSKVKNHAQDQEYHWATRARNSARSTSATYVSPSNFSAGPSWSWKNELNEQVRHSPLIDDAMNVYITTTSRVRKFTSNGKQLWTWSSTPETGIMCDSPTLYKGAVILLARNDGTPTLISLRMSDGTIIWNKPYDGFYEGNDAKSMSVFNDTVFFGAVRPPSETNATNLVVAASAVDGSYLWEYFTDDVMWNFSPASPGDETLIFSGSCGAVFRISFEGKLIWRAGPSHPDKICTPSGGALGPLGLFYAEYNEYSPNIFDDQNGVLAAYRVSDGTLAWRKDLGRRGAQYPAVGMLDGRVAVIVPVGDNPQPPMPKTVETEILKTVFGGALKGAIFALDALDGSMIWQWEEPPWPHMSGAGEAEMQDAPRPPWPDEGACWPDALAIPLLLGDGTVYYGSSHGGGLSAIRDSNHNGIIEPSEVNTFETGYCFLNSPSAAPGMLVAAPCWGDVYVFK